MDIYFDIINTEKTKLGIYFFNLFGNIYIPIMISIGILIIVYLIYKFFFKKNLPGIITLEIAIAIILYFCFIRIYSYGQNVNNLKIYGTKIVNCLEEYKTKIKKYPENLNDLYPICLNEEDYKRVNQFQYALFKKEELNIPHKSEYYKEDYYSLTISDNLLGFYYLRYNNITKTFDLVTS